MATATAITKRDLRKYLNQWEKGKRSKSEIERTEFGNTTARGKFISRLWSSRLGVDTYNR